ncbi:RNA-binding protein 40-like [Mizuhopecten yessoensis]|uniref:RNA-binding region-containing protein 3 n=1 Tax=Mizuhopecten yessoensis TaxID=6573 RepID=A0A210Q561_MIZYE|nr:RNA-binding protein 40-like [Mizuhopecten yessoensis]OWF43882.1 RNA-binding protein 40 [Mizuhopecten yessoensis]
MANSMNTLFVRHLPGDLSPAEKEDLLGHFGAENVKVMGKGGRMKYTAFATFRDHASAKEALSQLHQLDVLGSRLIVEFAKESQRKDFPIQKDRKVTDVKEEKIDVIEDIKSDLPHKPLPSEDKTFNKWSLDFPRNPRLTYLYPPPNMSIISNIANTVAAFPKLYVQVLHLMNKMNLPSPFGALTAQPPLAYEQPAPPPEPQPVEAASSEESEIESDEDRERSIFGQQSLKRPALSKSSRPIKVPRLVLEKETPRPVPTGPVLLAEDVFEQANQTAGIKKIQLKLPETVVKETCVQPIEDQAITDKETVSREEGSGFGKIAPTEKPSVEIEMKDSNLPYSVDPSLFLKTEQIQKGRISTSEMKNFSVFKRYDAGEPTTRLYIKNLAKHTTEQDIVNLYGQYVNWQSDLHKNMFDVRLMKEGRMKGQAFVTFPTEEAAGRALKDTNGYVINTKPMVVQFARSAKAKD